MGRIADRIGFTAAVRAAVVIEAVLVGALALTADRWVLALSSLIIGAFVPGITTLVLGRVREAVGSDVASGQAAWSIATAAFALGQAAAAYGYSYLFAKSGLYTPLFALGAVALLLAFALDVGFIPRPSSPPRRQ